MSRPIITITSDKGLYELCVGIYSDDGETRLEHDDYVLNREQLWQLKQQVDRAWVGADGE